LSRLVIERHAVDGDRTEAITVPRSFAKDVQKNADRTVHG